MILWEYCHLSVVLLIFWRKLCINHSFSSLDRIKSWILEFYSLTDGIKSCIFIFDQRTNNLVFNSNAFCLIILILLRLDWWESAWLSWCSIIKLAVISSDVVTNVTGVVLLDFFRCVVDENWYWIVARQQIFSFTLCLNIWTLAKVIACNGYVIKVSLGCHMRQLILFKACSFYRLFDWIRHIMWILLLCISMYISLVIVQYVHFHNRLACHQFSCQEIHLLRRVAICWLANVFSSI